MTKSAKYVALAALFIIPFLPLYVADGSFFPFITGKGFLFRILVEIAFVAWALLAVVDKRYRPRFSWTFALYGAFALWMFIADLFAINAHKAFWSNFERMDGYVTLIHVFLFFVVAGSILSADKLWKKWWRTFIGAAALVCGYGLLQLMGMAEIHQSGVRLDASLGNSAYLAAYLIFALGVTAWQAFESKGWLRYVLGALALIEMVIIFNTATRGAILGIVAAAGVAALLAVIESSKKGRQAAVAALAGVLILVGGFWFARDSAVITSSPIFSRIASISFDELATRFTLWDMALEGVLERPLTGYGQDGYNYVFNEHYRPSLYGQEPWFDRAHNVFIDWLVAGGFPAFLLFIALLISAVLALYRNREVSRAERILLTATLAGDSLQAMVVFDNLFTYMPLAAILAMAHHASSRPIRTLEKLPVPNGENTSAVLAPIGIVFALILVWSVNVPNMRAAGHLVYAISPLEGGAAQNLSYFKQALADGSSATQEIREQLVTFAVNTVQNPRESEQLKVEIVNLALAEMMKEIERAPEDARLYMQLGYVYRAIGRYDKALEQVDRAITLSPNRQNFLIEKSSILTSMGKLEEARAVLHRAYELDVSKAELAPYAAAGDIYAGDVTAGKALLLEQFGTTTVDSMALVRVYYETKRYADLIEILELQARNTNHAPEAALRLASGYAVAGRIEDARTELRALIKAHPEATSDAQAMLASLPGQ